MFCRLTNRPANSASWGIVESSRTNLLVGKALVDLQRDGVPVRVLNLSDQPRRFKRSSDLAKCVPVTTVSTTLESTRDGDLFQMPDFLMPLYEKSVANLPQEQKVLVYNLLCRNADVFSQGPDDLGRTDLDQHHVHTGDSRPI